MTDLLLQTKLHVPSLRLSLVPRPRLIARLNAGLAGKLILVSTPAGYGKTKLVTEWLFSLAPSPSRSTTEGLPMGEGAGVRAAWLSLDEGDNDPRRFLAYLFAALRQIDAGIGKTAGLMMQSPKPPPSEVLEICPAGSRR